MTMRDHVSRVNGRTTFGPWTDGEASSGDMLGVDLYRIAVEKIGHWSCGCIEYVLAGGGAIIQPCDEDRYWVSDLAAGASERTV